jgi:hypothetical protein
LNCQNNSPRISNTSTVLVGSPKQSLPLRLVSQPI